MLILRPLIMSWLLDNFFSFQYNLQNTLAQKQTCLLSYIKKLNIKNYQPLVLKMLD